MSKKVVLCLLSVFAVVSAMAQTSITGFNVDDYPEVSFVYHTNNPEPLGKDDFLTLQEGDEQLKFKTERLPVAQSNDPQTTIILWEDMASHSVEQFQFTKQVLTKFFKSVNISGSDKFEIYVFNRRKNNASALKSITGELTGNCERLLKSIDSYQHSKEYYSDGFPHRSDIYTAIDESLDVLARKDGVKSVILFTAGYPMINSGSTESSHVLESARKKHIPVYIFQYYQDHGVTSSIEPCAVNTYGTFYTYKRGDAEKAADDMVRLYPDIRKRYHGQTYKITFTSKTKLGDAAVPVVLSLTDDTVSGQLVPPPYTFGAWVRDHLIWIIVGSIVGLIVILLVILSIVRHIRKAKKAAAANKQELQELEQRRINDKMEADANANAQKAAEARERAKAQRAAEEERLLRLMTVKNMFPRLKCSVGNDTFTCEINKPVMRVGRESDNDVVLNKQSVSRHHAEIVFNGSSFEIIDKRSTNKVIVNGQFVECTALKSGDIIGLGEAVVTFYV